jgi:alpha-tubulin suppressor-like RCC1 family protein
MESSLKKNFISVKSGEGHTLALTEDGSVYGWGFLIK